MYILSSAYDKDLYLRFSVVRVPSGTLKHIAGPWDRYFGKNTIWGLCHFSNGCPRSRVAKVKSQTSQFEICGGKSGNGMGIAWSTSV